MKIQRFKTCRGFTLVEMLVALAVLSILGTCLTLMLNSGMSMWRAGERRRQMIERSTAAQDMLREDFAALLPPPADRTSGVEFDLVSDPSHKDSKSGLWAQVRSSGINDWAVIRQNIVESISSSPDDFEINHEVYYRRSSSTEAGWIEFEFNFYPGRLQQGHLTARAEGDASIRVAFGDFSGGPASFTTVAGGAGQPEVGQIVDLQDVIADAVDNGDNLSRMFVQLRLEEGTTGSVDNKLLRGSAGSGPGFVFRGQVGHSAAGDLPTSGHLFTAQDDYSQRLMFWRSTGQKKAQVLSDRNADVAEVVYFMHENTLWRGQNTSRLPEESLFLPERTTDDLAADPNCVPMARGVLFFGVRFWGPGTEEWTSDDPDVIVAGWTWDPDDPDTPGLPEKVQIVLVMRPTTMGGYSTTLQDSLPAAPAYPYSLRLAPVRGLPGSGSEAMHVLIGAQELDGTLTGGEWVRFSQIIGGGTIVIDQDGRARRGVGSEGAPPVGHPAGSDVYFGQTDTLTIDLPASD